MIKTVFSALCAIGALAGVAQAQLVSTPERNNTMQVVIREPGNGPVSESLTLPLGQAAIIHLPVDAVEVMVASDTVASAVVRTPRRALLLGQ